MSKNYTKNITKLILGLVLMVGPLILLSGCDNVRAKAYGGTMTVEIDKDQKLVNASWKRESLWILTRARKEGEVPETYKYAERSTFGILEGAVIIQEK